METTVEKINDSEVKLTIDLNKEDLEIYLKKAEKALAKNIKMKGFRKGKVPPNIIKDKINQDEIKEQALNIAMRESFDLIIKEKKLDLLETSDIKVLKNNPDHLQYEAKLVLFPNLVLGEYKGIEIDKKLTVPTKEEIGKVLDQIQKTRAQYKDIDGPTKKGNKIEVDFEVTQNGKVIEGGESKGHPLVIGNGGFIPGFEEQLIGLKKDDKKEFTLKAPDDYYVKPLAGKNLDFKIEIKKIQEVILPEINDDLAKQLGKFENLDALKKNITEGLTFEKDMKEKERIRLVILEKVSERSQVNIPNALIERQLDRMLEDFDKNLQSQGMELGLYLAKIKKTKEDLRKDWGKQAEKQVKMSLVLKNIGTKENLEISEEEITSAVNEKLSQFRSVEEAQGYIGDLNNFREKIKSLLLNEKIFQLLEKESKVKSV